MISIYRFIIGYVRIKIFGERPESLINACFLEGITVWRIARKNDSIILSISASDFIRILQIRKKLVIRPSVKLLEKHGMPFFIKKHKNRTGILVGMVLFLFINLALSGYIWDIKITGNDSIDSAEILSACKKHGVIVGSRSNKIDVDSIKHNLPKDFENIAWASLNVEGSVATINVSEAKTSEVIDNAPSNIVASTDGYIRKMEVASGLKTVQVGTSVRKGDLLVSGMIPFESYDKYVKSKGIIIAETYKKVSYDIDKTVAFSRLTGQIKKRSILNIFNIRIPLYLTGVLGENKTYNTERSLNLFGKNIPIGYTVKNYIVAKKESISISSDQAESIALSMLCDSLTENILKVESYKCKVRESEEGFRVDIEYVCLENIGVQQLIHIDSGS